MLGKYPQDTTLGLCAISPLNALTPPGLLHQPSSADATGGPETALGTAQVARWVFKLPPWMIIAKPKNLIFLYSLILSWKKKVEAWRKEMTPPRPLASCWRLLEQIPGPLPLGSQDLLRKRQDWAF